MSEDKQDSGIIEDRETIDKICKNLEKIGIDADIREIHDNEDEYCSTASLSCYGKNNNLLFHMSKKLYEKLGKKE